MKWLLSLLLLVLLAAVIGVGARYAPGYVLFVLPHTRVEMSLTLFVLLSVAAFVLLYAALSTFARLWRLPARAQAYRQHRRRSRARSAMQQAMSAYLEGRYEQAEQAAARALGTQETAQLASVLAARAAQSLGRGDQGEAYLKRGEQGAAQATPLLQITRAHLLFDRGAHAEALRQCDAILQAAPRAVPALRLALQCHVNLQHWSDVERIGAQLGQLGRADDPVVRSALQAAAKYASDALTRPARAGAPGDASVVALRPRQGGQ